MASPPFLFSFLFMVFRCCYLVQQFNNFFGRVLFLFPLRENQPQFIQCSHLAILVSCFSFSVISCIASIVLFSFRLPRLALLTVFCYNFFESGGLCVRRPFSVVVGLFIRPLCSASTLEIQFPECPLMLC